MEILKRLKEFLAHLRKKFGYRDRSTFPKRSQDKLNRIKSRRRSIIQKKYPNAQDVFIQNSPQIIEDISPQIFEDSQTPEPPKILGIPIDIDSTDIWHDHVTKLKNISTLNDFLDRFKILLESRDMVKPAESIRRNLNGISDYVDKKFKVPEDIDTDTSEEFADRTGKFVKNQIWDLLRACNSGIKYDQDPERNSFWRDFLNILEDYLLSIHVYKQNDIKPGLDFYSHSDYFEVPFPKDTFDKDKIGIIDEIEVYPHVIPYLDGDRDREERILRGVCIVFVESKNQ